MLLHAQLLQERNRVWRFCAYGVAANGDDCYAFMRMLIPTLQCGYVHMLKAARRENAAEPRVQQKDIGTHLLHVDVC